MSFLNVTLHTALELEKRYNEIKYTLDTVNIITLPDIVSKFTKNVTIIQRIWFYLLLSRKTGKDMKNPTTATNLLLEHSLKYFIALESKIKQLVLLLKLKLLLSTL